jgi:hypothetical protein
LLIFFTIPYTVAGEDYKLIIGMITILFYDIRVVGDGLIFRWVLRFIFILKIANGPAQS